MNIYLKISFYPLQQQEREVLTADLSDIGFYAFDEDTDTLNGYILEKDFDRRKLDALISADITYNIEKIKDRDWNIVWEQNFQPVVFDDFMGVRARFHLPFDGVKYDIVITPKMSFGTGHHATTALMIRMLEEMNLRDKSVIDFGTGTGILAILMEKMGARSVVALDNDDWSIENARENIVENGCRRIRLIKSSSPASVPGFADVVLANITADVLASSSRALIEKTAPGGFLLLSGFLQHDREKILSAFDDPEFFPDQEIEQNDWMGIRFRRLS